MMKKVLKYVCIMLMLLALLIFLTGCEKSNKSTVNASTNKTTNSTTNSSKTSSVSPKKAASNFLNKVKKLTNETAEENAQKQMAMPEEGETIAVLHIKDYGDVTLKFFDEVAPKAVENFVTHAKEGYYNGVTFHRIIDDFMIQGGDPLGTGMGGESIFEKDFDEELSETILPYRGSISMASRGTGTSSLGSQFFINTTNFDEENSQLDYFGLSNLEEVNKKYGGNLAMLVGYAQYTTFGQVIEGMEVVDEISTKVKVEDNNGTVLKENQPIIESIEIKEYKAK